jgi:hypothetical protein
MGAKALNKCACVAVRGNEISVIKARNLKYEAAARLWPTKKCIFSGRSACVFMCARNEVPAREREEGRKKRDRLHKVKVRQ